MTSRRGFVKGMFASAVGAAIPAANAAPFAPLRPMPSDRPPAEKILAPVTTEIHISGEVLSAADSDRLMRVIEDSIRDQEPYLRDRLSANKDS